jgi:hypothetical protein
MSDDQFLEGELHQYDEPDWQPLYDLIGVHLADWFMWMHEIELETGLHLHAYKHITTRRYFHLARGGTAFGYWMGGHYQEFPRRDAIDAVFREWEELTPPPDAADLAALRKACRAAGPAASTRRRKERAARRRSDAEAA